MNTLKPYQSKILGNIYKELNIPFTPTETIKNMNTVYFYITDKDYNITTKRDYLIMFAVLLRKLGQYDAGDVVYSKAKEYNEQYLKREVKQTLDENEKKNYIQYNELLKKVHELVNTYNNERTLKNIINVLILGLYVLHPPLRNDYNDMKIIYSDHDNDKKRNYFLIDRTTNTKEHLYYVIINKDKVSKTAGSIEIPITNSLLKSIIKVYFNEYAYDNTYLFEDKKHKAYTKRQIQYVINNMFEDKVLNVYNLRSAYISNFYKLNLDYESRHDLALQMRHSKDTAELIYCKFF